MLDIAIIIGMTMGLTELIKKRGFPKEALWLPVLGIAAILNAANALAFNGVPVDEAVAQGIKYGAIASGIYGLGKKALKKKDEHQ